MQLKTLQIVWHSKEPVFSVDFQPSSHSFVTGGQDGEFKHWEVARDGDGGLGVRFLSSAAVHSKCVNCVRFSPTGELLATGGDSGEVVLWRHVASGQQPQVKGSLAGGDSGDGSGGCWRQLCALRGHNNDVFDLAWSPDGSALLSGGIENECIVWDVDARRAQTRLQAHGHYVQGVAWDPLGHFLASQSSDRTAKLYAVKQPAGIACGPGAGAGAPKRVTPAACTSATLAKDLYLATTLSRALLPMAGPAAAAAAQPQAADTTHATGAATGNSPVPGSAAAAAAAAQAAASKAQPLFADDMLATFFRRLAWSPDGSLLVAPAGILRSAMPGGAGAGGANGGGRTVAATHVFARGDWAVPVASLPCLSKGALAVRFCPRIFKAAPAPEPAAGVAPQQQQPQPLGSGLPYCLVWAVASQDSVLLYSSLSPEPLAVLGGLHLAAITDLAWSHDGRYLVVASRDGYCSLAAFEEGELGEEVPLEQLPQQVAAAITHAAARRHAERVAAAAAARAAAAAAAPATAPPPPAAAHAAAPAADARAAVAHAAAPAVGAGAVVAQAATAEASAPSGTLSGSKRPAPEATVGTSNSGGAQPAQQQPAKRRIMPVPISAMQQPTAAAALASARPAAASACAGTISAPPLPTVQQHQQQQSAQPTAAPAPAARRITPILVAPPMPAPAPAPPAQSVTPLPPATAPAAAGAAGDVPPGSAAKLPTPVTLSFSTPVPTPSGAPAASMLEHVPASAVPGADAPPSEQALPPRRLQPTPLAASSPGIKPLADAGFPGAMAGTPTPPISAGAAGHSNITPLGNKPALQQGPSSAAATAAVEAAPLEPAGGTTAVPGTPAGGTDAVGADGAAAAAQPARGPAPVGGLSIAQLASLAGLEAARRRQQQQ